MFLFYYTFNEETLPVESVGNTSNISLSSKSTTPYYFYPDIFFAPFSINPWVHSQSKVS